MLPEDYQQYDPVTEADVMAGDYPKLSEKSAMIHLRSKQIRIIKIKTVGADSGVIIIKLIIQGSILPLGHANPSPQLRRASSSNFYR